jgi:hypothetical protein
MAVLPLPRTEHRLQLLRQIAGHMQSPLHAAAFRFDAAPARTGFAESFVIVTLDPADLAAVAAGRVDLARTLRATGRWHHQMLVGGLPAYAESWDDDDDAPLGTLATGATLSTRIDRAWRDVGGSVADVAEVRLLRVPRHALVAFVATQAGAPTRCWIVAVHAPEADLQDHWLDGREFARALIPLEAITGFVPDLLQR